MCKHCPTLDVTPFLGFARKGAEFLDENGPQDWRDMIAPGKLDLGDGSECVLGQIYNGYSDGTDALGICEDFAATAGFATPHRGSIEGLDDYDSEVWDRTLTAAWRQILAENRTVAVVADRFLFPGLGGE